MLDLEGTFELLRGVPIPCWLLASVVLLSTHVGPVGAAHEFTAHRMQHFDLHGIQYGSRSALVNMEAKGVDANMLNRRCVFIRWTELSLEKFLNLIERGAGSMVILLPPNMQEVEDDVLKSWRELEAQLFERNVAIPVYFAIEDSELKEIRTNLIMAAKKEKTATAVEVLLSMVTDYGYQIMTEEQRETKPVKDPHFVTLVGKLSGQGLEHKLPTVALLAHYDSMGLAPTLSHGYDSNASGVAAILELARLFSKLYSDPKTRPRYNLLFVLSGGGNFNYFGTKALLDEQLDDPDSSLFPSADYTLCLDTLASAAVGPGSESKLYLHLSKPLKEGMRAHSLVQLINKSAEALSPDLHFSVVHKKIRLSEDLLSWEHERFSLKRLPAATLSSLSSHKEHTRKTMFATKSSVSGDVLTRNVKIIAEGLARHIFNMTENNTSEITDGFRDVHKDFMWAWLKELSGHALSPQLVNEDHPVIKSLEEALSRYTHDVTKSVHKPEKSEPDVVVYDLPKTLMKAYRMKPAVFDLFLAIGIAGYSLLWYCSLMLFPSVLSRLSHLPFFIQVRTTKLD